MKKLKNKKTFLIFLLGFYAAVAVFTGVVMYLPYLATEEYYEDETTYENEDEDSEGEDNSEDEDSYDEDTSEDEEASDEEDSYDEENSDDEEASDEENFHDEEASDEEDSYDEENSEDEDFYDEENSEDENFHDEENSDDEDFYDEDNSDDEDFYDEEASDEENSEDEDSYIETDVAEDETANTSVPHTMDNENGSHNDSNVVPTPISQTTVNNISFSYNGKGKLNLREEPSKSGSIVGSISTNTKGIILEFTNDEWAKVTYNDKEGYVAYEYIEYTLPEGTVTPSPRPSLIP